LLAACGMKGHVVDACVTVLHILAHLWLHQRLRGARRAVANRALVLGLMMALHCLHATLFIVWVDFPAEFVEMWRRNFWIPVIFLGVFHQSVNQVRAHHEALLHLHLELNPG
jgi:hypothetical protein